MSLQAARLNLRMQRELKLLLTDPPPGISFPTLHSFSASSLTSIDALLQGPDGTVYANGVFKIKIQIPERYPFQPPIVTFSTPIYHPNIDNGGRICLDILHLPPKGMWQPSLNISTVLTSIGLLLSEPNPDDGLVQEASRDYKYNRQAFDQNARSMTEKYARAAENESNGGSHGSQTHTGRSTGQTEMEGSGASTFITEHGKLSLESLGLGSSSKGWNSGREIYKVPIDDRSKNHTEFGPLKEANDDLLKYTGNLGMLQATRNKHSKVSVACHGGIGESEKTSLLNHSSSQLEIQPPSMDSPESLLSVQVGNIVSNSNEDCIEGSHNLSLSEEQQSFCCARTGESRDSEEKLEGVSRHDGSQLDTNKPQESLSCFLSTSHNKSNARKDAISRKGNCSSSIRLKKTGLVGLARSLGPLGYTQNHLVDEKENLAPVRCLAPQQKDQPAASAMSSVVSENGMYCSGTGKQAAFVAFKPETAVKLPRKPVDQLLGSNSNMILHSESPSSPHSKYLHLTDDVTSDKQQQRTQVCGKESTGKFNQLADGEGLEVPEAVIVLDSEDSEDENVPMRSKLSPAKRCLSRKRKTCSDR